MFACLGCTLATVTINVKGVDIMKRIIRLLAAALCLFLAFSLFGCKNDDVDGSTAADTTENSLQETEKPAAPPPLEADTYTVPLRVEKDGKLLWEYTYSSDGLSLSRTDYREETPITYTVTFDGEGNPLRMEWVVVVNDTRTEKWRDDYYLDEDGRIIEEKRYCEGQIQNAFAYTYDSEGRMDMQTSRDPKQRNTIYKLLYDDMGTHVGTRFKKYNGEAGYFHEMKTCTYDKEGRLVREETSSYATDYEYTLTDGLVTQKKVTSSTGDFKWSYYYQYTYENGHMVKEDCLYDGVLTDTTQYAETEFEHYFNAINWIFRERLP